MIEEALIPSTKPVYPFCVGIVRIEPEGGQQIVEEVKLFPSYDDALEAYDALRKAPEKVGPGRELTLARVFQYAHTELA